jgi:hypothetical protein
MISVPIDSEDINLIENYLAALQLGIDGTTMHCDEKVTRALQFNYKGLEDSIEMLLEKYREMAKQIRIESIGEEPDG